MEPDYKYALNIQEGMEIASSDGNSPSFRTLSQINFNEDKVDSKREVSVYERDTIGNLHFIFLKKMPSKCRYFDIQKCNGWRCK